MCHYFQEKTQHNDTLTLITMVFYLGHPTNGAQTVSDALRARNIDLLRASPSDIHTTVKRHVNQPAFDAYIGALPAFMQAHRTRENVSTRLEGYTISTPITDCFPFTCPPLIVEFKASLPDNHLATLTAIGYREVTIRNNKRAMVFDSYTLDDARTIRALKPDLKTPTVVNTINLEALGSLVLILRIFTGFLKTHTYPAFSGPEDEDAYFAQFESVLVLDKKRKRSEADVGGKDQMELDHGDTTDESSVEGIIAPPLSKPIALYRAKPQRVETNCWGFPSTIPNTHGILCPFVPPLASFDKTTVPHLIMRYFFDCLGPNFNEQTKVFDALKSSWGVIYKTDAGDILSHLGYMISLAITAQARAYPLFENQVYSGCFLSGFAFTLRAGSVCHRPISYTAIQEEMGSVKFQSSVLSIIAAFVSGDVDKKKVEDATSMRALSNVLKAVELTEDNKDSIKKEAIFLNFPVKYWALNSTTIGRAISLISDAGKAISDDVPLHPLFLFDSDRIATVLSAFGYSAPSFMIPSCPSVALKGTSAPKTFVYRTVEIGTAISDWKVVLKSKAITNNPSNLSKIHKDRSLNGGEKVDIWSKLCGMVNAQATTNVDVMANLEKELASDVGGESALNLNEF